MNAGVIGSEHKHDVEHCWYILSGRGTMLMGGKAFPLEPEMAVFAPAGQRVVLFVAALCLIKPGWKTDLVGIALLAAVFTIQYIAKMREIKHETA